MVVGRAACVMVVGRAACVMVVEKHVRCHGGRAACEVSWW